MDPVTLTIALTVFGALAVVAAIITIGKLVEWFRSRGKIKDKNANAIAFTLADRINNKQFAQVDGVFTKSAPTRIVQGFYDQETGKIIEARGITSDESVADEVLSLHQEGNGLVIYN